MTRCMPWEGLNVGQIVGMVLYKDERPPCNESMNKELVAIMRQCWAKDPKERPHFEDTAKSIWPLASLRRRSVLLVDTLPPAPTPSVLQPPVAVNVPVVSVKKMTVELKKMTTGEWEDVKDEVACETESMSAEEFVQAIDGRFFNYEGVPEDCKGALIKLGDMTKDGQVAKEEFEGFYKAWKESGEKDDLEAYLRKVATEGVQEKARERAKTLDDPEAAWGLMKVEAGAEGSSIETAKFISAFRVVFEGGNEFGERAVSLLVLEMIDGNHDRQVTKGEFKKFHKSLKNGQKMGEYMAKFEMKAKEEERKERKARAVSLIAGQELKFVKAAETGVLEVVRAFIEAGEEDVNAKHGTKWTTMSNKGGTALSRAARNGHLEVCRVLVEEGRADVNKASDNGDTPLSWATTNKHVAIIDYLEGCLKDGLLVAQCVEMLGKSLQELTGGEADVGKWKGVTAEGGNVTKVNWSELGSKGKIRWNWEGWLLLRSFVCSRRVSLMCLRIWRD